MSLCQYFSSRITLHLTHPTPSDTTHTPSICQCVVISVYVGYRIPMETFFNQVHERKSGAFHWCSTPKISLILTRINSPFRKLSHFLVPGAEDALFTYACIAENISLFVIML